MNLQFGLVRFIVLAAVLASIASPAPAAGVSLADLLDGGSLQAGNARFDTWQLLGLDDTGAPPPDLSLIQVTPLVNDPANPGLQFTGAGQLSITGQNAVELELRFQVHAGVNANSFAGHSLTMTAVTFGGDGGIATISQEVATVAAVDLAPTVVIADNESDVSQLAASAALAPHLNLSATLNVFLIGFDAADSIELATFTQRFAQTGPATLAGDFNNDKRVNGADFLLWQRGLSPAPMSPQDLAAVRNNFGADISVVAAALPVPEPATGVLSIAAFAALSGRLRRASSSERPRE
jgi:hypothetical protein